MAHRRERKDHGSRVKQEGQAYNVSILRIGLLLFAEFGGKGDRISDCSGWLMANSE